MKDITTNDTDTKKELPVHVMLGAGCYTKIKTQERARVGQPEEPIEELTKHGWVVIFPGQETSVTKMLFSKTLVHDYRIYVIWMYLVSRMNTQTGMEKYTMNSKDNLGAVMKGGLKQI